MLVRLAGAFARAALLIRPRSHVRLAAVIANGDVLLIHVCGEREPHVAQPVFEVVGEIVPDPLVSHVFCVRAD